MQPQTPTGERISLGGDSYLAASQGSWLFWFVPGFPDIRLRVQFDDLGDRWTISGLCIDAGTGELRATQLRELPLGRIDRVINGPRTANLISRSRYVTDGVPLDPASCPFGVAEERTAQFPLRAEHGAWELKADPTDRRRDDEFYARVLAAYEEAAATVRGPVLYLALKYEVPDSTMHRWLREARRRQSAKRVHNDSADARTRTTARPTQ